MQDGVYAELNMLGGEQRITDQCVLEHLFIISNCNRVFLQVHLCILSSSRKKQNQCHFAQQRTNDLHLLEEQT